MSLAVQGQRRTVQDCVYGANKVTLLGETARLAVQILFSRRELCRTDGRHRPRPPAACAECEHYDNNAREVGQYDKKMEGSRQVNAASQAVLVSRSENPHVFLQVVAHQVYRIDEVHILKEARGATLEAVVSRMKSVGSAVRFVALSATVPNLEDIAQWLGKCHTDQHLPAYREHFGEEFRPVKLQKFVYGIGYRGNDFGFEGACDPK